MARLTATEVARNFSAVLNRVAAGEEIEVIRSGASTAVLGPARTRFLSAERFRELLESAPAVDAELAGDLREIRVAAGKPESAWPS